MVIRSKDDPMPSTFTACHRAAPSAWSREMRDLRNARLNPQGLTEAELGLKRIINRIFGRDRTARISGVITAAALAPFQREKTLPAAIAGLVARGYLVPVEGGFRFEHEPVAMPALAAAE